MTGQQSGRERLRDAQLALAARATLLTALLLPALVAGTWPPVGGAAVAVGAVGAVGSAGLVVAVWASLAPVVLRALALCGAPRVALPRQRLSACLAIRRPEEPGRPGRARPRAPGARLRPRPAR